MSADRLWRIDAPTLVVAGARDAIVPLDRQQMLAEGIIGPDSGSFPMPATSLS